MDWKSFQEQHLKEANQFGQVDRYRSGANPTVFALTVALATSNSFLLPTHQVNALIMGPAGYGVSDYLRAGSIMTVLFICVMMVMLNLFY